MATSCRFYRIVALTLPDLAGAWAVNPLNAKDKAIVMPAHTCFT
ncbi:hypothetical protein HP15_2318 [Marinobacter adhaerens HP15]|jgi:hypothetical protein|uniref:Uncharacterized protein n=1 Tax=Marinobacter adhaerens (strain DSM 23420 / HP15) TaxID=225937 RepID=E4PGH1_MARAH|nr:hypothetical protein HP15_2318 [Marinobacter adhaerens HP15]